MADLDGQRRPDLVETAAAWLKRDGQVVVATIVDTWGSAPVPTGGQMVVSVDGGFEGSVSGGCVEGEVVTEAADLLETSGTVKSLGYGVEDETAWRVGLPCGGRIRIHLARLTGSADAAHLARLLDARQARRPLVIRTMLDTGARDVFDAPADGDEDVARRFVSGASGVVTAAGREAFVHALLPPPRLFIVGATHMAQALAVMIRETGYDLTVVDPRTGFANAARFPGVRMVAEWPQDAFPRLGLDAYTAVAALSHVGHIDDEALKLALASECFYVGALGSRKNHAKRIERLVAAGVGATAIARIRCPIGIDIGASTPPEIAASVLAEIIRALRGRKGKGAA